MRKSALPGIVCALLLFCFVAVAAEAETGLAGRLPADRTMFYAHVDLAQALPEVERRVRFVDEQAGGTLVFHVENLYGLLRELAANYRFEPALFDHAAEAKLSIVSMLKAEPEVRTRTFEVPQFDWETGDYIEGEVEEHTVTTHHHYTTSLVVRAPNEAIAADFLQQFRDLFDFLRESDPTMRDVQRLELDVEEGELIGFTDEDQTIGRLGRYIVVSDYNPRELWEALMGSPAETLAQTPIYGRLVAVEREPQFYGLVNLRMLVQRAEEDLRRALQEAEEKHGDQPPSEDPFTPGSWELEFARSSYESFLTARDLLSLDKLSFLGGAFWSHTDDRRSSNVLTGHLTHTAPISPLLRELLEGSGSYQLPAVGVEDEMALMGRIDLKRVYDEVAAALQPADPHQVSPLDMMMGMLRMQIGADVGDILGMLASDFYLLLGVARKDIEIREFRGFDEQTQEPVFETVTREEVVPELTALWGLRDPASARRTLDTIFSRLAADPQTNSLVRKRSYQETDVYCFGMDMAQEESYPDGLTSFGVAVLGRYMTFGGWEKVTGVIRRIHAEDAAPDEELRAVVEANRGANFIAAVPRGFREKVQHEVGQVQKEAAEDIFDVLLDLVRVADFALEDPALERELRASLEALIGAAQTLGEKGDDAVQDMIVITGQHRESYYEIRTEDEVVR